MSDSPTLWPRPTHCAPEWLAFLEWCAEQGACRTGLFHAYLCTDFAQWCTRYLAEITGDGEAGPPYITESDMMWLLSALGRGHDWIPPLDDWSQDGEPSHVAGPRLARYLAACIALRRPAMRRYFVRYLPPETDPVPHA